MGWGTAGTAVTTNGAGVRRTASPRPRGGRDRMAGDSRHRHVFFTAEGGGPDMDGQALLWVVAIAMVACCLIPMNFMAMGRRRETPGGADPGGRATEPGDGGYRGRNNGHP